MVTMGGGAADDLCGLAPNETWALDVFEKAACAAEAAADAVVDAVVDATAVGADSSTMRMKFFRSTELMLTAWMRRTNRSTSDVVCGLGFIHIAPCVFAPKTFEDAASGGGIGSTTMPACFKASTALDALKFSNVEEVFALRDEPMPAESMPNARAGCVVKRKANGARTKSVKDTMHAECETCVVGKAARGACRFCGSACAAVSVKLFLKQFLERASAVCFAKVAAQEAAEPSAAASAATWGALESKGKAPSALGVCILVSLSLIFVPKKEDEKEEAADTDCPAGSVCMPTTSEANSGFAPAASIICKKRSMSDDVAGLEFINTAWRHAKSDLQELGLFGKRSERSSAVSKSVFKISASSVHGALRCDGGRRKVAKPASRHATARKRSHCEHLHSCGASEPLCIETCVLF